KEIRKRYLELRIEHSEWDDDRVRHQLCRERYKWKQYASAHNLNFMHITNRETTEEKIEYQNYMIKLMKQVESGEITFEQSRAMVNDYFKEKSAIHSKPLPKKKK